MSTIDFAYRQFCRERFPLPTDSQLRAVEMRIGVELPADYRQFILEFNGGYFSDPTIKPATDDCPEGCLAFLCGLNPLHEEAELGRASDLTLFDDNVPPKILPIGATPMGNLIILDTAPGDGNGAIYFKQAFGNFYYLADGIEEFFTLLRSPTPVR